jgi:hypothetical protein
MKRACLVLAVVTALLCGVGSARADFLLKPTVADIGETNNGINFVEPFSISPNTVAYVGVGTAGNSTYETAVQFDLSPLQGSTIISATLSYATDGYIAHTPGNSSFDVSISGYSGTGTMGVFNFTSPALFTAGAFQETFVSSSRDASLTPISLDVTSFVLSEATGGVQYGGFILGPTNVVTSNTSFTAFFDNAMLTVEVATVPEPACLTLVSIASVSIAGYLLRRRSKRWGGWSNRSRSTWRS